MKSAVVGGFIKVRLNYGVKCIYSSLVEKVPLGGCLLVAWAASNESRLVGRVMIVINDTCLTRLKLKPF